MADNPVYSEVSAWVADELVTSTKLNQMNDNIIALFKQKLGLSPQMDAPVRFARVQKSISLDSTVNNFTNTITFSSDCVDGDPAFSAAPTIIGLSCYPGSVNFAPIVLTWNTRSATSVVIRGDYIDWNTPSGFTLQLHMGLVGPV